MNFSSTGHEDFALQLLQQGPEVAYAAGRPVSSLARVAGLQPELNDSWGLSGGASGFNDG